MDAKRKVLMLDTIRSNILEKTGIKNKELAVSIAREWLRKAGK